MDRLLAIDVVRPALLAQLHAATPDPRLEAVLIDAATVTFRKTLSRARRR